MATKNTIRIGWKWGLLLLAAAAVMVTSPAGRPARATGGNSITSPDTADYVGLYASLALDASGYPVVSYCDDTNNDLKVLHCNDEDCAGADESIEVPFQGGCEDTSIALDSSGYPVVSFRASGLQVMHCNDADCAGDDETITEVVEYDDAGHYTSLELDAVGHPVVSFYSYTPAEDAVRILHCNDPDCSGDDESITTPDTGNSVGLYTSLELDADGYPVVSYFAEDVGSNELRVMHCNDANCAGGNESITGPDSGLGSGAGYTSLGLDEAGLPVVSYYDHSNGDLKILHCNDANCAGGDESITSPDTAGDVGQFTSLALDANGYPVVSYLKNAIIRELKVMHCNDANCAGSDESITSPDTTLGWVGSSTSLVLDEWGLPIASYVDGDGTDGDLKLLHCSNADCATYVKFVVDSTSDAVDSNPGDGNCDDGAGNCTLRAAIQESNALAGLQQISVPAGTYTLTIAGTGENAAATGDLDITDDLTITGAGADTTTVNGGALDTVFDVRSGADVEIAGITITNGSGTGRPGGIYNLGSTLTLTQVSVAGNTSDSDGGGIYNTGTLDLSEVSVEGNSCDDSGGGVYNDTTGTLTIDRSTISGNTAAWAGGGIENRNPATIVMTNSTVSSNEADDQGGGIRSGGPGHGSIDLSNVTITGNTSDADSILGGSGGGLFVQTPVSMRNTLLAGNVDNTGTGPDCYDPGMDISSEGYNLMGVNTGCTISATTGDQVGTGASPIDPLIGTLRDNGGPTKTHSLPVVSPAVDAGSPAPPGSGGNACEAAGQRGEARPLDGDSNGNTRCDIGAYEAEGATTEPCPNQPDLPPPDAGCTDYSFTATLQVTAKDLSPLPLDCNVSGAIVETRDALGDDDTDGLEDIGIEIIFLSGFIDCPGPLFMGTSIPSTGVIEEQLNTNVGELDFPVNVEADICLVADTYPLGELENCQEGDPTPDPLSLDCAAPSMTHADCVVEGTSSFVDSDGQEKATVDSGEFELVELPPPVGGEAEALASGGESLAADGSSGVSTGTLAGIAAAAFAVVIMLAGGAWYTRRRVR